MKIKSSNEVNNGNDDSKKDDRPSQRGRFDFAREFAAERSADQRADCHDEGERPQDLTRKQEEDRRGDVDCERDRLLQRVEPRQRIVQRQPQGGEDDHAQARAEISAVDGCRANAKPRP